MILNENNSEEEDKIDMICNNSVDVLTLIRNITLYKLVEVLDLKVIQLLSLDYEKIYVLVNADEQVLKKEAARLNYTMQIEAGTLDLLSFEPVAADLRPLRFIKVSKPTKVEDLEKDLKLLFKIIYMVDTSKFPLNQSYKTPSLTLIKHL